MTPLGEPREEPANWSRAWFSIRGLFDERADPYSQYIDCAAQVLFELCRSWEVLLLHQFAVSRKRLSSRNFGIRQSQRQGLRENFLVDFLNRRDKFVNRISSHCPEWCAHTGSVHVHAHTGSVHDNESFVKSSIRIQIRLRILGATSCLGKPTNLPNALHTRAGSRALPHHNVSCMFLVAARNKWIPFSDRPPLLSLHKATATASSSPSGVAHPCAAQGRLPFEQLLGSADVFMFLCHGRHALVFTAVSTSTRCPAPTTQMFTQTTRDEDHARRRYGTKISSQSKRSCSFGVNIQSTVNKIIVRPERFWHICKAELTKLTSKSG